MPTAHMPVVVLPTFPLISAAKPLRLLARQALVLL